MNFHSEIVPLSDSRSRGPISLLIVGDKAYQESIRSSFASENVAAIELAGSIDLAIDLLGQRRFDAVIFDFVIDGQSALVICDRIRLSHAGTVAAVVASDEVATGRILKAFRSGVSDYVVMQGRWHVELEAALHRAVRRCREIVKLIDENEYLAQQATFDRVTGLPNRAYIEDRFTQIVATARRYDGNIAIMLIDINRFKHINDTFGHIVGDKALRAFGAALTRTLRSSDIAGRYGGDEFLVIVDQEATTEAINGLSRRLVKALSFSLNEGAAQILLSASIGVAFYPTDGETPGQLVRAADDAMYSAKSSDTHGYHFANGKHAEAPPDQREQYDRSGRGTDATHDEDSGEVVFRAMVEPALGELDHVSSDHSTSTADEPMNRRREHRMRVFKPARIILNNGYSVINCIVRDISDGGARISLEDAMLLPEAFSIELDSGAVRRAMRRWRRGKSVGLEFAAIEQPDE